MISINFNNSRIPRCSCNSKLAVYLPWFPQLSHAECTRLHMELIYRN